MKPVIKTPAPQRTITPDEHRVLAAWRSMECRRHGDLLRLLEFTATERPRHVAPALRLVRGGSND